MAKTHKQKFIRLRSKTDPAKWFAHPELRPRLVAEAERRGVNMTEVAVGILCDYFSIAYEPNGRRTHASPERDELNVLLPIEVIQRLREVYVEDTDGAREILCGHYGLEPGTIAERWASEHEIAVDAA